MKKWVGLTLAALAGWFMINFVIIMRDMPRSWEQEAILRDKIILYKGTAYFISIKAVRTECDNCHRVSF